ncbi:hypothetical protein AGDE_07684 [Angomonas deanei]|uniref:Uncharacterized protein n=1 Tax=Angomonas deanei TaxID=59799 RepID=A0A7G2CAK9_9TRYP|nr:hypothetical protein AGDE_07684 [Angomonas deanei]CAD2215944.1 hypothetical protein, conserved [Angomonas deanei]|eukprot:EPY34952.1 hypothetical protein AGDE_07684 [Angomonas deanei]
MSDSDLNDLVNKLRSVTGHVAESDNYSATVKKVNSDTLLLLEVVLRNHPCALHLTPDNSDAAFQFVLQRLEESLAVSAGTGTEFQKLYNWINEVSQSLEEERLRCVVANPKEFCVEMQSAFMTELGIEEIPQYSQNSESYQCPWNILFVLLSGFVQPVHLIKVQRGKLTVPNPTPGVVEAIEQLQKDEYDTAAWKQLLLLLDEFPISSVRNIWAAAMTYFPSCGPIVAAYVQRELEELRKAPKLAECGEEKDTLATFKDYLRLFNTFYRHLHVCCDIELYNLYFDFIVEFVQPDEISLHSMFRAALKDVGHHPLSTPLWRRYIESGPFTTDRMKGREWTKRVYINMLQTPLQDLEKIKEDFDNFITMEFHGRLLPEEQKSIDKRFTRAKADANDLLTYIETICSRTNYFMAIPPEREKYCVLSLSDERRAAKKKELISVWYSLLLSVKRSCGGGNSSSADLRRQRSFLRMRACFFGFDIPFWAEYLNFSFSKNSLPEDRANAMHIGDYFMKSSTCFALYIADLHVSVFHDYEAAFGVLKKALLQERKVLIHYLKTTSSTDIAIPLYHLQNIAVIVVNWMRMGMNKKNLFHSMLVAQFAMHQIDFLSLTMGVVKKLLIEKRIATPEAYLKPFHTFLYYWIRLELIRNRRAEEAFLVTKLWAEHLKLLLSSGKEKGWTPEEGGVDQLFFQSCHDVVLVHSAGVDAIVSIVDDLHSRISPDTAGRFTYAFEKLKHSLYMASGRTLPAPTSGCVRVNLSRNSIPIRYDAEYLKNSLYTRARRRLGAQEAVVTLKRTRTEVDAYPDESLWLPFSPGSQENLPPPPAPQKRERERPHRRREDRRGHSERGILSISTRFLSLGEQILYTDFPTRSTPPQDTTKLEALMKRLPTFVQYNPEYKSERVLSNEWLVDFMRQTESMV